VFWTSKCQRDVSLLAAATKKVFRRRYFPSQTAILRRQSAQSQEKEKEMGGFCLAETSSFIQQTWAMRKITTLQRDG